MDPLYIALGLCFIAAIWFVPIGTIRLIAYRSGSIDHTRGMRNVALTFLSLGLAAFVSFVVMAVIWMTRA
ncbi:MAG: hypothetical protein Q4F67_14330 [Propionibacteriaceae bacterium]|nr:hypothetical protein [Propionibacteriaceae bacterium]